MNQVATPGFSRFDPGVAQPANYIPKQNGVSPRVYEYATSAPAQYKNSGGGVNRYRDIPATPVRDSFKQYIESKIPPPYEYIPKKQGVAPRVYEYQTQTAPQYSNNSGGVNRYKEISGTPVRDPFAAYQEKTLRKGLINQNPAIRNGSNPVKAQLGTSGGGTAMMGTASVLGEVALQQTVIMNAEAKRTLQQQIKDAGLTEELADINVGFFGAAELSEYGKARIAQAELQRYIDRQQAKPEVRRKLYDRLMANQGGGSSSSVSGGYQGRMNSSNPTAGTRPYLPAYTPPIPDANFPGGFVPVTKENYPPFQDVNPGGTNPANDFKSPAPEDFVTPYNDPLAPRTQIWLGNGNLPPGFEPSPPSPGVPQPGRVAGKLYIVQLSYATTSIQFGGEYPDTTVVGVYGPVGNVSVSGGNAFLNAFDAAGNPKQFQFLQIDPNAGRIIRASVSSLAPAAGYPPDPILPGDPQPAPQIPTNPDGSPDLPEIDTKPTIDSPTSPARSPSPSPRNSPSGQPSPTARPDTTPTLNPGIAPTFQPFAPPQIQNPLTPKSPSNPLANPTLPLTNPAAHPSTGNPTKTTDLPGTSVTINGEPVQNGDTPIRQITAQPSRQMTPSQNVKAPSFGPGTNVTINGQPVNTPANVNKPDGTVDPEKVQQREQQKQPQTQPEAPRKTCDDPCIQGLHDKLDTQGNNNSETIEFKIFKECSQETGEAVYTTGSLSVPKIASAILKAALDRIAESQGEQCSNNCECYAAIPDWWQIRLGADIPQAVVQYAEVKADGKFGSPKYAVSIPHYAKSREATVASDFPTYIKGQRMGILTLRDNSKLIVNADGNDADRVIKELEKLIEPLWLTGAIYSDGKRKGTALKTIRVAPRIVKFFPTGQTDTKPKWIKYF
ncbi:hypothetical protein ACKFKG_03210 [Phormidesmis sp. 146-35]